MVFSRSAQHSTIKIDFPSYSSTSLFYNKKLLRLIQRRGGAESVSRWRSVDKKMKMKPHQRITRWIIFMSSLSQLNNNVFSFALFPGQRKIFMQKTNKNLQKFFSMVIWRLHFDFDSDSDLAASWIFIKYLLFP
jgi:hypothetical protein